MAKYNLFIKSSAAKEIEAVGSKRDRTRIAARIGQLADDPRPAGCEKLSGQEKYRIRQGQYRIIYSVKDEELVVHVVKIGHRKDVYR